MGRADYWQPGDNNSRCQECGEKYKISQLRLRWDNFLVCWRCWEPRQPQDYLRGFPDLPSAPLTTSDPPFVYVGNFLSTPDNRRIDASLFNTLTMG
jgi:hypothetical protein